MKPKIIQSGEIPTWLDPTLENKLDHAFNDLNVSPSERETIETFLAPLKEKDIVTLYHYQHCIKVGLLTRKIAEFMHLDQKELFYAGLLHDIGKSCIDIETLAKADLRLGGDCIWTQEDATNMEAHVIEGYNALREKLSFTADIIVRHHRFQKNSYPKELPPLPQKYSEGTKVLVDFYARLVALADVYDAFHRVNKKFGTLVHNSKSQIKDGMLKLNPELGFLVNALYDSEVF